MTVTTTTLAPPSAGITSVIHPSQLRAMDNHMPDPMPTPHIDATWTVDDVLHTFPGSGALFNAFGIDTCCGAHASLEEAARDVGLAPSALVDVIERSHGMLDRGGM